MTDYYPLLSRAVSGLEKNTGEARRALYERARNALVAQLRSTQPPLPEADITRERLALEDAVRKVEADEARRLRTPPGATSAPPIVPPSSPPRAAEPPPRAPVPRPEDLRRQNLPPVPSPTPSAPPRAAPPASPPPRPAVPPGMQPSRPPVSPPASPPPRPAVPPGLQPRPPEPRAPAPPRVPPQAAEPPRRPPPSEPPRARAPQPPVPPAVDPLEQPLQPPPATRPPPRRDDYPADLDATAPPPPPPEASVRRRRPPGPAPRRALSDEKPANPGRRGLIAAIVAILIIGCVGAGAFWQRDKISSIFNAAKNLAPSSQTASNQPRQKSSDRVGQEGQTAQGGQPVPVAQRVVLYEEDPANPEGNRASGSVIWRTETVSPGPGLAPELAVRADVEIPERKFAMTMSIRRNTDTALPASHTVEIFFNLPADFSSGAVDKVPGILMKEAEQARGAPLAGLAVKVTNGFFLIGLSSAEADKQRNTELLKDRAWFDVPMVFSNNRRAILAMEKGTPGERAFSEAFAAWNK